MNKDSTVPTAVAFIGFIAVVIFCFIVIKDYINKNSEIKDQQNQSEVGILPDIKMTINGKQYTIKSESNKATENFLANLPLSIELIQVNENEKKGYVYFKLITDAKKMGKVEEGDLLLYGDSYVILATKAFKTKDMYTKLGHIQNIDGIPDDTVNAYFTKEE